MQTVELNTILGKAAELNASDIHIKAGLPPVIRKFGQLLPLKDFPRLNNESIAQLIAAIMNEYQKARFETSNELDMSYNIEDVARFRVNCFKQRENLGMVFRIVPTNPPDIENLNMPEIIKTIALERSGLILVTGTTGSGKSTTLAAMVNYINTHRNCHVLTIEDPIEFLHKDRKSIVNQREIGVDTNSFSTALRAALRQDPDVILVGEMRDKETIDIALMAAETGHLVMSTLHPLDAVESIMRIITVYPPHQHQQVRIQLASVLKAVISQRLIQKKDADGMVPAAEIMVSTGMVKENILDEKRTCEIHDTIGKGSTQYGMQTFDQSLMDLVTRNLIDYDEALKQATNPNDFILRMKGFKSTSDTKWDLFEGKDKAEEAQEKKDDRIDRF